MYDFSGSGNHPAQRRGFLHKKLLRIGAGLLPGPIGAAFGVASTFFGKPTARGGAAAICPHGTAKNPDTGFCEPVAVAPGPAQFRRGGGFSGGFGDGIFRPLQLHGDAGPCNPGDPSCSGAPCPPGTVWDPGVLACVSPKSPFGAGALADQFGEAVNGQFGAALVPGNRMTNTAVCPRGSVVATDGLCYNKKTLSNKNRQWPRGRQPLLTGGEMRAISTAAAAARKVSRTEKRLRSMGMLKALPRRAAPKQLPSGHHAHVEHN